MPWEVMSMVSPVASPEDVIYYAQTVNANDFTADLLRVGGTIVDITDTGIGGLYVWDLNILGLVNGVVDITQANTKNLIVGTHLIDISGLGSGSRQTVADLIASRYYTESDINVPMKGHKGTAAQPLPYGKETSLWVAAFTTGTPTLVGRLVSGERAEGHTVVPVEQVGSADSLH